jgi:phosphoglycolate phosphatase-like HAD superfamily hydrolase
MIAATPGSDLNNGTGGIGRPRALLFDWDNTLVDNWDVITDAMNAVYDAFGMPRWTIEEAKARIRSSMRDAFPKAFGERAKEAGRIFSDYFAAHHLERLREMPGAGGLLRGLAGSGLHLGVVSNKRGRFLRLEAERLGWTGHFGRLVGAADASVDKPAVEPVALALAESGETARARCLVHRRYETTSISSSEPVSASPAPISTTAAASSPIPLRSICGIAPGWRRDYMPSGFCRPRIYDRQLRSTDRPSFHLI